MRIGDLKPPEGATKKRKRVGRGSSSGKGKTSGRGHKGSLSRSGSGKPAWFEG
ncbi:50S ribosomal protein L15, partial [bacterium]